MFLTVGLDCEYVDKQSRLLNLLPFNGDPFQLAQKSDATERRVRSGRIKYSWARAKKKARCAMTVQHKRLEKCTTSSKIVLTQR